MRGTIRRDHTEWPKAAPARRGGNNRRDCNATPYKEKLRPTITLRAKRTLGGEEGLSSVIALIQPEHLPKDLQVLSDVEVGPVVLLAACIR